MNWVKEIKFTTRHEAHNTRWRQVPNLNFWGATIVDSCQAVSTVTGATMVDYCEVICTHSRICSPLAEPIIIFSFFLLAPTARSTSVPLHDVVRLRDTGQSAFISWSLWYTAVFDGLK